MQIVFHEWFLLFLFFIRVADSDEGGQFGSVTILSSPFTVEQFYLPEANWQA